MPTPEGFLTMLEYAQQKPAEFEAVFREVQAIPLSEPIPEELRKRFQYSFNGMMFLDGLRKSRGRPQNDPAFNKAWAHAYDVWRRAVQYLRTTGRLPNTTYLNVEVDEPPGYMGRVKESTETKAKVQAVKDVMYQKGLPDTADAGPIGNILGMAGISAPPKKTGLGRRRKTRRRGGSELPPIPPIPHTTNYARGNIRGVAESLENAARTIESLIATGTNPSDDVWRQLDEQTRQNMQWAAVVSRSSASDPSMRDPNFASEIRRLEQARSRVSQLMEELNNLPQPGGRRRRVKARSRRKTRRAGSSRP